jgi:hypothetical protein
MVIYPSTVHRTELAIGTPWPDAFAAPAPKGEIDIFIDPATEGTGAATEHLPYCIVY